MAKKTKRSDQSSVISDQTAARELATKQLKAKEELAYVVGNWAGLPHFSCVHCGFDTLDEAAMLEHIEAHRLGTVNLPPDLTPNPTPAPSPFSTNENGEGGQADVFEVELEEIGSIVDEQGDEHKTFTVKE